ncbi:MAG: IS1595 family transposase [Rhodanobacteraceae bacterium]
MAIQNSTRGAARREMARAIMNMNENEAESFLAAVRFGDTTQQACPHCGLVDRHYRIPPRRQWRCRDAGCGYTFSVTSGTRLDQAKLSPLQILRFLTHFESCPKGTTLVGATNAVCMTEKCSQQNTMKTREAIMEHADRTPLSGTVHMDGAHVCGKFRRSNRRVKATADSVLAVHGGAPIKRRLRAINPQSQGNLRRARNKRVMIAMVERDQDLGGARRVIVAMCRSENAEDALALARRYIAPGTTIFTDENPAYNALDAYYQHYVVNHSEEYSTLEGVNENLAEAFFSRMRRSQYGIHHGFRPENMELYAWEFAWRETNRRRSQTWKVEQLARWLLSPGYSRRWRGYHGGNRRRDRRHPRPEIVRGDVTASWRDARSTGRKGRSDQVS